MKPHGVWICLVGSALAYDVFALRRGTETLSAWCRRHPTATVTTGTYLMAHLLGHPAALHRYDPLHVLAGCVRTSRPLH